jgi:hypothetical protein
MLRAGARLASAGPGSPGQHQRSLDVRAHLAGVGRKVHR